MESRRAPWLETAPEKPAGSGRKPRKADPVSDETRALVRGRSGGVCEIGGCGSAATHVHHRQLRRYGDHSVCNLLHLCGPCHTRVHGHPRYSMDVGWIVSQYDDPRVRETLRNDDWVWLGAGGELLHLPPATEVCS